ncbi:MAG: ABC transporter ATP-binding protein [Marivibrio sp.]|uniref:ABC transporter ATP-binding protein n=1 Tax=Marivibrio sp. TaxID=2039719 RepID=UPI0032EC48E3
MNDKAGAAAGAEGSDTAAGAPRKASGWSVPGGDPYISIRNVTKRFGDFVAVDDVSLDIYRTELFSLLGASGCGKTTLLRMLAGLEQPSEGQILIDGQDMVGVPPYERPVNMMFQSYALFPHMTVAQNIAFGLKQEGMSKAEIGPRVDEMLRLVQLDRFAKRKPHQLSGGQRQRVALARALAKRPKLLLLDEPLAALDKKLRESTQFELMNIQEELGVTFIVVTHDQEEAMTLSTRVAVMNEGVIQQIGTPSEVYEYPTTRYVADFIGSVNLFEGRVSEAGVQDGALTVGDTDAGVDLHLDYDGRELSAGQSVAVAIRPEKIAISKEKPDQDRNLLRGIVDEIAYQGALSIYQVRLSDGKIVRVTSPNLTRTAERPIDWEEEVWLSWGPKAGVVLTS